MHVHDENTVHWGSRQMRPHLQEFHGITVPMAWTIGQMHKAHLDSHQGAATPAAEKVCEAYYGVGDGTAETCQRPAGHPEISEDGIGHSPQPIPIQPKAQEATMTQIPTSRPADADDGPRKLYAAEKDVDAIAWDDLGQESRDFWRAEYAKQTLSDAVARPFRHQPVRPGALTERHADHRIMVDRFTAAMAGLDFERDWAADDGIGANARGALRITFQRAAEQLLYTLERGGLLPFGPLTEIEQGALTQLKDQRDAALRARSDAERQVGDLRAQMAGQQRALQEMAQAQGESESLVKDLEEVNNDLRAQLRLLTEERNRLDQQMGIDQRDHGASLDAVQRQLEQSEHRRLGLFGEMEQIRQRLAMTQTASTNLQQQVRTITAERDDLARRNEALEAELQAVSTVTEASQVPAEPTDQPPVEAEEHYDLLAWARRFAEGDEA